MKKISLLFTMFVLLLSTVVAQNNWDEEKTEEFIKDLYLMNKLEINLGQLTFTKNVSEDLMELGMMIVKDHEKANMKLKEVAMSMNIELPEEIAARQDNKTEKFYRMNPVDFEDAYVDRLINHHKKGIDKLKEAKDKVKNNEFSEWVDNIIPVLKNHLDGAKNMQDMKRWKSKDQEHKVKEDDLDANDKM